MKVRWTQESVRLRITPSELDALEHGQSVEAGVGEWGARISPGGDRLGLTWDGPLATVSLSRDDLSQLLEPAREGIYSHDHRPRILVEKDFPCRHPHSEEAREVETERFEPTSTFLSRKGTPS